MTVTYEYNGSLYLNITNRCSNACDFCVRTQADGYYSDDLWLDREPSKEEILSEIIKADPDRYDSVVFCGYGEPTERFDDMLFLCRELKKRYDIKIRLNTNGQSDLICQRSTAPELEGLIDTVSISLNAPCASSYQSICHSGFGEEAFDAILSFAKEAKKFVPNVVFTAVRGSIPDDAIEECRAIAKELGIGIKIREYIKN